MRIETFYKKAEARLARLLEKGNAVYHFNGDGVIFTNEKDPVYAIYIDGGSVVSPLESLREDCNALAYAMRYANGGKQP